MRYTQLLFIIVWVTGYLHALTSNGYAQAESPSPQPESPPKEGLPARAVPPMPEIVPTPPEGQIYVPLFRLTTSYYDNILAVHEPEPPFRLDPSEYREASAYEPIQGLLPLRPASGLANFKPFAEVDQSYDSNIQQTSIDHIGDFFTTLRFGFDSQVGSPDSAYSEGYDTILALKTHYEFFADIFTSHDQFNALNNKLQLEMRIGRSDYIWRPFVEAEDVTGSSLITVERVGRTERQRLTTGVHGDYRLTSQVTWSQTFSHLFFEHPEPAYINLEVYRNYQEIAYRALHNYDVFGWGEYRYTDADKGADADEAIGGFGWRGKPDPRLFSELLIGWDSLRLNQFQDGRDDLSGIYISGHTSFEWGPRLRLVLKYDRGYIFNEVERNDNYRDNTLQFSSEIFLGGNWYLTPYLGVSYNQFELQQQETLEIRPEIEVAYALPNESRFYVKLGYDKTSIIKGSSAPIEIYRFSSGVNWHF